MNPLTEMELDQVRHQAREYEVRQVRQALLVDRVNRRGDKGRRCQVCGYPGCVVEGPNQDCEDATMEAIRMRAEECLSYDTRQLFRDEGHLWGQASEWATKLARAAYTYHEGRLTPPIIRANQIHVDRMYVNAMRLSKLMS
jgi:hypothetical protein